MVFSSQIYPFERHPESEMIRRAQNVFETLRLRRSVRHFSSEPIPMEVVRAAVLAAAQAPSGANKQPWTFVVVTDPQKKKTIRKAAEAEEESFYGGRAPKTWLDDLAPLGTDSNKPFLEEAPALIVVFSHGVDPGGKKNYYVRESVGIACGMLLAALQMSGVATLTHTPSPMGFLAEILDRPDHERPYLLIPIGYPATDCRVPQIVRKAEEEVLVIV